MVRLISIFSVKVISRKFPNSGALTSMSSCYLHVASNDGIGTIWASCHWQKKLRIWFSMQLVTTKFSWEDSSNLLVTNFRPLTFSYFYLIESYDSLKCKNIFPVSFQLIPAHSFHLTKSLHLPHFNSKVTYQFHRFINSLIHCIYGKTDFHF